MRRVALAIFWTGGAARRLRAEFSHLLTEDQHAETEQRWYGRERWEGKLQQGSAELEWWFREEWQEQQWQYWRGPQRIEFVGLHDWATRHRPRHDIAGFDAGRARLEDW